MTSLGQISWESGNSKELAEALKLLFPDSICQTRECTISFEGIMRLGARVQKPKLAQRVYEDIIYYS